MTRQSSADKPRPLAISFGDPAGVGPQASLQAWLDLKDTGSSPFYVRGHADLIARRARESGLSVPVIPVSSPIESIAAFAHGLPVIDLPCPMVAAGAPEKATADAITSSIRLCVEDVWNGEASAVVTNPIAKSLLKSAGFQHPGHTEYLAELAGELGGTKAPHPVMMLIGGGLRVALATIHMPLMKVGGALSAELITDVSEIVIRALKQDFAATDARLGVAGLNPHAGEDGMLGSEEIEIISPALEAMRRNGRTVIGPRPGDTVFHEMLEGRYDAVLAMYHDQGLAPLKTLDIWGGVNVTLGLPFIRTSPDHGTAYDAAASFTVNANSLITAIQTAQTMADNRQKYDASHD